MFRPLVEPIEPLTVPSTVLKAMQLCGLLFTTCPDSIPVMRLSGGDERSPNPVGEQSRIELPLCYQWLASRAVVCPPPGQQGQAVADARRCGHNGCTYDVVLLPL